MAHPAVLVLSVLLLCSLAVIACLIKGATEWYDKMVEEQEAHLRTRRQLYACREEEYWWRQCANEYMEEVKRLNGANESEREAC